jgi:hypothetical protein
VRQLKMKLQSKVLAALVALGGLSFAPAAFAGEGGAAGAAAFTINPLTGFVDSASVAAGVGKQDAAAAAYNIPGSLIGIPYSNAAYAHGSAGTITSTNIGDPFGVSISGNSDPALGTPQANQLSPTTEISVDKKEGTVGL